MKLGSFAYLSSNLFIHLVKTFVGTTRYSCPPCPFTIAPYMLKLIMKLNKFCATNLEYSF